MNINRIGRDKLSQELDGIKEFMLTYDVDIFKMAETGINWRKSWEHNIIWEQTMGWFKNMRLSGAQNTKEKHISILQP